MSGIYIKGLEMPKDGEILCIQIMPSGKVSPALDIKCREIARALPVPDHGRLGDLDSLEIKMRNRIYKYGRESDPDCLVADAPTIIPADRKGEA